MFRTLKQYHHKQVCTLSWEWTSLVTWSTIPVDKFFHSHKSFDHQLDRKHLMSWCFDRWYEDQLNQAPTIRFLSTLFLIILQGQKTCLDPHGKYQKQNSGSDKPLGVVAYNPQTKAICTWYKSGIFPANWVNICYLPPFYQQRLNRIWKKSSSCWMIQFSGVFSQSFLNCWRSNLPQPKSNPDAPCMEYSPTFTINLSQM